LGTVWCGTDSPTQLWHTNTSLCSAVPRKSWL